MPKVPAHLPSASSLKSLYPRHGEVVAEQNICKIMPVLWTIFHHVGSLSLREGSQGKWHLNLMN
jgi:hypothetical protein